MSDPKMVDYRQLLGMLEERVRRLDSTMNTSDFRAVYRDIGEICTYSAHVAHRANKEAVEYGDAHKALLLLESMERATSCVEDAILAVLQKTMPTMTMSILRRMESFNAALNGPTAMITDDIYKARRSEFIQYELIMDEIRNLRLPMRLPSRIELLKKYIAKRGDTP